MYQTTINQLNKILTYPSTRIDPILAVVVLSARGLGVMDRYITMPAAISAYIKNGMPAAFTSMILIGLLVLMSIATAPVCYAAHIGGSNADLKITVNELTPQPAEPGQDLVLSVIIDNRGAGAAEHVTLTIIPDSSITLKNENSRVIYPGTIIGYAARVETYTFHIDPGAVSGNYEIELGIRWIDNGQRREQNVTVPVVVRGVPQLVISEITIVPESIGPDDMFDMSFLVSNEGTGTASAAQVTAVLNNLPFVPVDADTKIIKKLGSDESVQLSYRILVDTKAGISSYAIPIQIGYRDENGKNMTVQNSVGVNVVGDSDLCIASVRTSPQNPVAGDVVTLMFKIENSGNGDARSVKVTIDIPFEGTKTAFLGRVEADDDAPCMFTFRATEVGNIAYRAIIEYEDRLGANTTTEELSLYVSPNNNGSILIIVVATVILLGTGTLYVRRKR